jgi:hypothetical protein
MMNNIFREGWRQGKEDGFSEGYSYGQGTKGEDEPR